MISLYVHISRRHPSPIHPSIRTVSPHPVFPSARQSRTRSYDIRSTSHPPPSETEYDSLPRQLLGRRPSGCDVRPRAEARGRSSVPPPANANANASSSSSRQGLWRDPDSRCPVGAGSAAGCGENHGGGFSLSLFFFFFFFSSCCCGVCVSGCRPVNVEMMSVIEGVGGQWVM